ncbi:hypothetical protein C8J57DRAFT_1232584 [Mycena rebaudengoi]|nr:hypothetical protein C8J57DRAFT_1232584 [Mycena rebaudengoi]
MTSHAGVPEKEALEEDTDPVKEGPKPDPAVLTLDPAALAEQMRLLNAKVERLEVERIEEASTSGSTTSPGGSSLGRSLSTMKSEQTRMLRSHNGYDDGATDSLSHTDSGLRLTAGRIADEAPPPTYQAD